MIIKHYDSFILLENEYSFKNYLQEITKYSNGYLWGILGNDQYPNFFVCDLDFKLLETHPLYDKNGKIQKHIHTIMERYNIPFFSSNMQSDLDLGSLKNSLFLNYKISSEIKKMKNQ